MEQSKFAEAEPLLLAGYRGLLQRKPLLPVAVSVEQAGQRVVQLYIARTRQRENTIRVLRFEPSVAQPR
jgi:hypothetical protein